MIGNENRVIWMAYEEIVQAVLALDGASVRRCLSSLLVVEGRRLGFAESTSTIWPTLASQAIEESPI
jgi:hypothetical protein